MDIIAPIKEAWQRIVTKIQTPHFVVGEPSRPYMLRWHVIPRNRLFNVYLHKFVSDDDDRALHDHPWHSLSILLRGEYIEWTPRQNPPLGTIPAIAYTSRRYAAPHVIVREATYAHRIQLLNDKPCWTLFITGPSIREWGFHCLKGWVHWKQFVHPNSKGQVGQGCDGDGKPTGELAPGLRTD